MAIQIESDRYIDTRSPGVFVNHSCDPNAGIRSDRYLVALRPLSKGQEIRYDYSTTMEEQSFTMQCLCPSPQCRRRVRDFSTLPQPLRERYIAQGVVMSFIVRGLQRGRFRPVRFSLSSFANSTRNLFRLTSRSD